MEIKLLCLGVVSQRVGKLVCWAPGPKKCSRLKSILSYIMKGGPQWIYLDVLLLVELGLEGGSR